MLYAIYEANPIIIMINILGHFFSFCLLLQGHYANLTGSQSKEKTCFGQ